MELASIAASQDFAAITQPPYARFGLSQVKAAQAYVELAHLARYCP